MYMAVETHAAVKKAFVYDDHAPITSPLVYQPYILLHSCVSAAAIEKLISLYMYTYTYCVRIMYIGH